MSLYMKLLSVIIIGLCMLSGCQGIKASAPTIEDTTRVEHETTEVTESTTQKSIKTTRLTATTEETTTAKATTTTTTKPTTTILDTSIEVKTYEEGVPVVLPISETDREYVASIVMNEAGYEVYEGQVAVAQCFKNALLKESTNVYDVAKKYGYTKRKTPTEGVKQVVYDVFYNGTSVTDEPILFYYNPAYGYSSFHESQVYVMTIGGHRFFKEK